MSERDEADRRPLDPATGEPLPPRAQPGYFPGHSTLAQQSFWDEATRDVVLARVYEPPPIRFFTADELPRVQAVFDRVLPQDDRDVLHRIALVNVVDARLHEGRTDGYRYDDMPPDPEAYRLALQGIDDIARHLHARPFVELDPSAQDAVLETLLEGRPPAGREVWSRVDPRRFFAMLVGDAASAYYAHPYAWDEIGFGGPAYPRGYMRLEQGRAEPWEVGERRYAWKSPRGSRSDFYRPMVSTTHSHGRGGSSGSH